MSWRPPGRHRSSLSSLSLHLSLEESLGPISSSVFPSEKQPCECEEYTRLSSPFSDLECDGTVTSRCQSSEFNAGYAKTGPVSCVALRRRRKDSGETHQPCYAATRDRLGPEKRRETKLDAQLSQTYRHLLHSFVFVQTPTTLLSVTTWTARADARQETAPLISYTKKGGRIELYQRRGRRWSRDKKPEERNQARAIISNHEREIVLSTAKSRAKPNLRAGYKLILDVVVSCSLGNGSLSGATSPS